MKKLLCILCMVLFVMTSCGYAENEIKVISYNIRMSGDPYGDGNNHWTYRKQATLNMIAEEQPAIIGMQEVCPDQMQFLVKNLTEYGHIGVGREDGKSDGEHMAVFYRDDVVELVEWSTFWLSETPDVPSKGWDAACKRSCTWALFRMKATGKQFVFINTHLDHVGKISQREGLSLIVSRMKDFIPRDATAFLTADFNTLSTDSVFNPLKAKMYDACACAAVTDARGTYHNWGRIRPIAIDNIFFCGAKARVFKVLCDKNYGAPYISDHYPVMLRASF